jgi:hypothetical protein
MLNGTHHGRQTLPPRRSDYPGLNNVEFEDVTPVVERAVKEINDSLGKPLLKISSGIAYAVDVGLVQGAGNIVQFMPKHGASGPISVYVRISANTAGRVVQDGTEKVNYPLGSSNCGSVEEFYDFVRRILWDEFRAQLASPIACPTGRKPVGDRILRTDTPFRVDDGDFGDKIRATESTACTSSTNVGYVFSIWTWDRVVSSESGSFSHWEFPSSFRPGSPICHNLPLRGRYRLVVLLLIVPCALGFAAHLPLAFDRERLSSWGAGLTALPQEVC